MDELSRDAMLAKQSGMSYGKWRSLQPPEKEKVKVIPKGMMKCEYCGNLFKKFGQKRFCDAGCRDLAYKGRASELRAELYRKHKNAHNAHN